ncbi:MAG: hypothetical protein H6751_13875 [Candidatus Omnitrophica bacterium]|nr:hypothetical protein [Candidatus Omnitrophota bacterium]
MATEAPPPTQTHQLRYYIALSAPPTREAVTGRDPYLRAEVGFTPKWFHEYLGVDFSEKWHEDPEYRLQSWEKMSAEVHERFPGRNIGDCEEEGPPDILTGLYGGCVVSQMFGLGVRYWPGSWPASEHGYMLPDEEASRLEPVDLENNPFFQGILDQCDRIEKLTGTVKGYLNWQGVLNTAFRMRGERIFMDLIEAPDRACRVFEAVTETMIDGIKRLLARQRESGQDYRFATISNCVVNMLSPKHYEKYLLPYDLRIRSAFEDFGIHNCAWNVNPYMNAYAQAPRLGYLDMGLESDFVRCREMFPETRRNLIYEDTDVADKSREEIRKDLERTAVELGPCDIGLPNIEYGIPDDKLLWVLDTIDEISDRYEND